MSRSPPHHLHLPTEPLLIYRGLYLYMLGLFNIQRTIPSLLQLPAPSTPL
jgi:hypothetical protein